MKALTKTAMVLIVVITSASTTANAQFGYGGYSSQNAQAVIGLVREIGDIWVAGEVIGVVKEEQRHQHERVDRNERREDQQIMQRANDRGRIQHLEDENQRLREENAKLRKQLNEIQAQVNKLTELVTMLAQQNKQPSNSTQ